MTAKTENIKPCSLEEAAKAANLKRKKNESDEALEKRVGKHFLSLSDPEWEDLADDVKAWDVDYVERSNTQKSELSKKVKAKAEKAKAEAREKVAKKRKKATGHGGPLYRHNTSADIIIRTILNSGKSGVGMEDLIEEAGTAIEVAKVTCNNVADRAKKMVNDAINYKGTVEKIGDKYFISKVGQEAYLARDKALKAEEKKAEEKAAKPAPAKKAAPKAKSGNGKTKAPEKKAPAKKAAPKKTRKTKAAAK